MKPTEPPAPAASEIRAAVRRTLRNPGAGFPWLSLVAMSSLPLVIDLSLSLALSGKLPEADCTDSRAGVLSRRVPICWGEPFGETQKLTHCLNCSRIYCHDFLQPRCQRNK